MAALDLGTNNCRLLIARQGNSGFQVIDAFSRIVRLGEGVSHTGALSAIAMDRTIEALKVCAGKMQRRGVSLMRSMLAGNGPTVRTAPVSGAAVCGARAGSSAEVVIGEIPAALASGPNSSASAKATRSVVASVTVAFMKCAFCT